MANKLFYINILVYGILVTQCWSKYLSIQLDEKKSINQLDTLFKQQQQPNDEAVVRKKSYDKNNDVVQLQQQQQQQDNKNNTGNFAVAEQQQQYNKSENYTGYKEIRVTNTTYSRKKRELSDWLIAPNTRWCGRGNSANGTYNYLGGASSADKCCRRHDHCQKYIPAMSNRFELFNYRPYTISHCNCDRRFRTCLKMANDEDANTIGKLFFNVVQMQCFTLRTEKVCSSKRAEDGSCAIEYVKHKAYLRNSKKF